MGYKTELHCHSMPASSCGRMDAEALIERYTAAGYTTLTLTNHLSHVNFAASPEAEGLTDWQAQIDFFLADYEALKAAARGRLYILLGIEFRLDCHEETDFLVYGLGRDFLLASPDILSLDFPSFSRRVREAGGLLIQAHPFRNNVVISDPRLLDGIEVYNASARHPSRNDIAALWADRFSLIKTAGSDLHRPNQTVGCGIETAVPIQTEKALLDTLRRGAYTLLCEGTPAEG
ncbi:MAG: hypothetical protein IJY71_02990 [Clostridia bacterium]|nr:hypothetical protein [Clostridia bacterium]